VIREDRELLAQLARLNSDMTPLAIRIMDDSASAAEQAHYAQRLVSAGEWLRRRAYGTSGVVIEGECPRIAEPPRDYRRASSGAVSNVWETRYRLLLEHLEELTDQLRSNEPIASAALEEQAVRLLAGVVMLLRQHEVNKLGRCRFCTVSHRWRFWRKRPQCAAHRALNFALGQHLDTVWWQLLDDRMKSAPRWDK
jgi:hypothetical protein